MQHLDQPPFEFGCSTLPFRADEYLILARKGHRLEDLVSGRGARPTRDEERILECIRQGEYWDSHDILEAIAWQKLVERRMFEREHPPPGPNRTWVRSREHRAGMIVFPAGGCPMLLQPPGHQTRGHGAALEYRNGPDLPWHRMFDGGFWSVASCLESLNRSELFIAKDEVLEAADGLDRAMVFSGQARDGGEVWLLDPNSGEVYHVPCDQVSWGETHRPHGLHRNSLVRVQWWEGEPIWVWGQA